MTKKANIILTNGLVFDGIALSPYEGGVAITKNKIVCVGTDDKVREYADDNTVIYDCKGCLISPGLNDGHTHVPYGAFLIDPNFGLNFEGESNKTIMLESLNEFADAHPQNDWVYGFNGGWNTDNMPEIEDLERYIKDRPVLVQNMDGHSMVANRKSFEKIGVDNSVTQPPGGVIGKTESGDLNGKIFDDACFLFTKALYNPSDEEFKSIYRNFLKVAARYGITAIGELYPTFVGKEDVYEIFKDLEKEDSLTVRIEFPVKLLTFDEEEYKKVCKQYNTDKLFCKGTKDLVDGVITVHTALMLEPYTDDPTTCGRTSNPPDEMRTSVLRACEAGVPVRMHCIGDGAVRMGLDFIEEAEKKYGYHGERHGIEHIESCHPDDIPRFKELHVCANMQPMHTVFDTEAEEKLRGDRCKWCWPMRDLLDAGAVMSMGTDFPIVGINPFHSLYAAVTRKDPFGKMKEGWQMHQSITIGEALKAHTYGSAYSQSREDKIGSLAEGKLADVIVIDRNLFDVGAEEIKDASVKLTIFDGKVIYNQM